MNAKDPRRVVWLVGIFAVIAVIVIALLYAVSLRNQPPQVAEVITYSTPTPDEQMPPETFAWRGGANDPKKISIERIGVSGFMQNVGVDQDGAVAVPTNVHIAGWFVSSVRPGETGLSIIDGHVDGATMGGIFNRLDELQADDLITVEFGDGREVQFAVFSVTQLAEEDTAALLFSQDPAVESQLNLVTCGGRFDAETGRFDDRVVVSAKRV